MKAAGQFQLLLRRDVLPGGPDAGFAVL